MAGEYNKRNSTISSSSKLQSFLESLPEWKDDDKMKTLFASFSQPREVNPESYDERFAFWKFVLIEGTRRGLFTESIFCLPSPRTVTHFLNRKGLWPLGIGHNTMAKEGLVREKTSFNDEPQTAKEEEFIIWKLAKLTLRASVTWGLGLISGDSNFDSEDSVEADTTQNLDNSTTFVIQSLLEGVARSIVLKSKDNATFSNLVFTEDEFLKLFNDIREIEGLSPCQSPSSDLELLINFMSKKKMIGIRCEESLRVIKMIVNPEQQTLLITDEEMSVIKLRQTRDKLELRITTLTKSIKDQREAAKLALRHDDKQRARYELCRSKAVEQTRTQNMQALHTITEILDKLDSAQTSKQILDAYKAGDTALKSVLSSSGSENMIESIDEVMVSLSESINIIDDSLAAIASPMSINAEISDTALEDELELLIQSATTTIKDNSSTATTTVEKSVVNDDSNSIIAFNSELLPQIPKEEPKASTSITLSQHHNESKKVILEE